VEETSTDTKGNSVMNDYRRCERCKRFLWITTDICRCVPFEIDYDGEKYQVFANDEDDAAEKWAEKYDEDEHPLLNYGEVEITVKNADGEIKKFVCSAEPSINYSANEIT